MREFRIRRAFQFGNDRLRQRLAEFHTPLVERIDTPKDPEDLIGEP